MNQHKAENHDLNVDITLYRNEILYDVNFASNRIARVRMYDENEENKDRGKKAALLTLESSDSDFKVDYIDRCIINALTVVQQKLRFAINPEHPELRTGICSANSSPNDVNNFIPTGDQSFTLSFLFEEGWKGRPQIMCNFIHSYIVNSILADWYQLTLPDQSVIFTTRANECLKGLLHEGRSVIPTGVQGFYL